MPFDLKTAIPVIEGKKDIAEISGGFDISTAKPVDTFEPTEKQSFVKGFGNNIMAGLYASAGSFNQLLGLGAFNKTRNLFITSAFDEAKRLSSKYEPLNKTEEIAYQFAQSLGGLATTLPIDVMTGGATKIALAGKVLPKVAGILSKIPDFAIGMGIRGVVKGAQKEGNVIEKTGQAALSGAENLAFGTIYGSIARFKIPAMAAIGAGGVAYDAFKEGKKPTQDDLASGAALGAAYGVFFSLIPFLQRTTKIAGESVILGKAKKEVIRYQNEKNLSGIKKVFTDLSTNKKLRPEIRKTFGLASEEVSRIEAGIKQNREGKAIAPKPLKAPEKAVSAPKIPIVEPSKEIKPLIEEAKKFKTAKEFVESQLKKPKYGMGHRPSYEDMPPAHNLLEGETLPRDVYTHPDFSIASGRVRAGDKAANESWEVLQKIKNKPETEITVYRASPKKELNMGDWITFSKEYAKLSAEKEEKVFSYKIKAKDAIFAGDDINEFGYYPKSQLTDIWKQAQGKVTVEKDKALTPSEKAKAEVETIIEKDESIKLLKAEQEEVSRLIKLTKGKIGKSKELKEELSALPKGFLTNNKNAPTIDKIRQELEAEGFIFENDSELIQNINISANRVKEIKAEIENLKQELITKRELTIAKQKLKNITTGIREGSIKTREQIKEAQNKIKDIVFKQSALDKTDRDKFTQAIINVPQDLDKAISEITKRISRLETKADINRLDAKIKKELKTTKPIKKGQKRVAKFEYESNKLFDKLREFNSLTKTKAQLELNAYPKELNSEFDLIKKRFLSLRTNGKNSSPALFSKVYEDILKIKEIGQAVKSEAELMEKINRQDLVDEVSQAIDDTFFNKDTVVGKVVSKAASGYIQASADTYSSLNTIAGKTIAEKYDTAIAEQDRDVGIYYNGEKRNNVISKIYNGKRFEMVLIDTLKEDYTLVDVQGRSKDISKQYIMDIYNAIKNPAIKERYDYHFGEEYIQNLIGKLDPVDLKYADYLMEGVQEYKEIYNQISIEETGRDNGVVEHYWPSTSRKTNITDDFIIQSEIPSPLKSRALSKKVKPVPTIAHYKAMNHMGEGEHLKYVSRDYATLKRIFNDETIENKIRNKFGDNAFKTLNEQIDEISLHKVSAKIDALSRLFGAGLNNWVTAKIAIPNVSTFVRQLTSASFYAEEMSVKEWGKYFVEGISSPKETFDFMWKNDPSIKARFNIGYSEALSNSLKGAKEFNVVWSDITRGMTALVRVGDIGAIIYGGYPMVKAELAKTGNLKEAILKFRKKTGRTQQSRLASNRSRLQNSPYPLARFLFAFKNTQNQFLRNSVNSVVDFANKDISKEQLAKTLFIYNVLAPINYVLGGAVVTGALIAAGNYIFGREDDEEKVRDKIVKDIAVQLISNPAASLPGISHIAQAAANQLVNGKSYNLIDLPLIADINTTGNRLKKKKKTIEDISKIIATPVELGTGLGAKTLIRYYDYVTKGRKR